MEPRGHGRDRPALEILVVCTGNAARSVMAGVMLEQRAQQRGIWLKLTTAGTHAVEGQPVSWRTKEAMAELTRIGVLSDAGVSGHRSRQIVADHLDAAALVVGMETDHIRWVRRLHPAAAGRAATMKRLCRDLPAGPEPLAERLAALRLAEVELEPWEDVEDPAGHELDAYVARAHEIWELTGQLVPKLSSGRA